MSDDCGVVMVAEPDKRFVAVGCDARPTRIWDTAHDRLLAELPSVTPVAAGGFTSAFPAVSSEGDVAAIARANRVELYELPSGRLAATIQHEAPVTVVALAPKGRALVSGAIDGSVRVTREDGTGISLQSSGGIDAVTLLPDGRVVVSDAQRRLRIYSSSGAVLSDLEMPVRIMSLRREATRLVALPSYTGPAAPPLLIDLERARVIAQLDGHVGQVVSARWVPSDRIITAGADGTVRLWDGATGKPLRVFGQSSRFLADATLLSDDIVIAGGADGLLRFWDATNGERLWTLPAHKSAVIGVHVEGNDIITRAFTGEVSRWRLPSSENTIDVCSHDIRCSTVPQ